MIDNFAIMVLMVIAFAMNHVGMERMFRSYEKKSGRNLDRVRAITVALYMVITFAFSYSL